MYEFKFSRPATVRQAANLLAKTEDAKLIAGGHTLVPVMKQRLARPTARRCIRCRRPSASITACSAASARPA